MGVFRISAGVLLSTLLFLGCAGMGDLFDDSPDHEDDRREIGNNEDAGTPDPCAAGFGVVTPDCDCASGSEPCDSDDVAPKIEIGTPQSSDQSVCATDNVRDCNYDFGNVPIGEGRFFTLTIRNQSSVELSLASVAFTDDSDPAFTIGGEVPEVVAASADEGGVQVTVRFVPTVAAVVQGALVIESNAANIEEGEDIIIQFTGNGESLGQPELYINPPECDFGSVGVGVEAFCEITIENVGQRELFIETVSFAPENPSAPTPVFYPGGVLELAGIAPGTGVSVRLAAKPTDIGPVTGALNLTTNDPEQPNTTVPLAITGANTVSSSGIDIQLTWDVDANDMDLHLKRGDANYCSSEESCYYVNCKSTSFSGPPDWDGDGVPASAGDPVLEIDDLCGYGPEKIIIGKPGDGEYSIGVHFYGNTGCDTQIEQPTNATIKVFVNEELEGQYDRAMNTKGDFWEVAKVQWSGGAATILPIDSYQADWSCPISF